MASSKREQLIDTAVELFYRDGFHATGIDKILSNSGVSRMTLYNHFRSKDELILAALHRMDEQWRNWFMRSVEHQADTPYDRLLAIFDVLGEWFRQKNFSGCLFVKASAEFSKPGHPIHAAAAEHNRLVYEYVRGLAELAGAKNPAELARQIRTLMEGALIIACVSTRVKAAEEAKDMVKILMQNAFETETLTAA
ncbi:MAG: TetR family transcriptional regulator [Gammaproteobacteria bacterium]|nr:TetR family transcriptional regulator [Gammaproteobacteria bacterium]